MWAEPSWLSLEWLETGDVCFEEAREEESFRRADLEKSAGLEVLWRKTKYDLNTWILDMGGLKRERSHGGVWFWSLNDNNYGEKDPEICGKEIWENLS